MKKLAVIAASLLASIGLASCAAQGGSSATYQKISQEDAKKLLDEGGVTLVDVRRADEYAEGHIPGAILIPNESIGAEAPPELPDKDAVILVYCRSGKRSAQASQKLADLGYKNIRDIGGIMTWPYDITAAEAAGGR